MTRKITATLMVLVLLLVNVLNVAIVGAAPTSSSTTTNADGSITFTQKIDKSSTSPHYVKPTNGGFGLSTSYDQDFGWTHDFAQWNTAGLTIISAKLKIRAYDVDSETSHGADGEYDAVSIDGVKLNPGYLQGTNNTWSETTFDIPVSTITDDGKMKVFVDIDSNKKGWVTTLDYSEITVTYKISTNNPPNQPLLSIKPTGSVSVNDDLVVSIVGPTPADPDGDAVHYQYRWFVDTGNGYYVDDDFAGRGEHTGNTVPHSDIRTGDKWRVQVTPIDSHDAVGNFANASWSAVVNNPPVANAGPDQTVEATSVNGASVTLDGSKSTDPYGRTLSYAWTGAFGTATGVAPTVQLPLGENTVTLKVSAGGVDNSDTVVIKVVDRTKPVLTVPADKTVEAVAANTPVDIGQATATDIFKVTVENNAPAAYPLGTTLVTWTAVDVNGNSTTGTQKITVVDTTAPVLKAPADVTAEATGLKTPVNIGQADASDIYNVTVTNDAPKEFPLGETIVTWTAKDPSGNTVTAAQKVTVVDTTKPELVIPANISVEADAVETIVDIGEATGTDLFGAAITNDAPAKFPVGTTDVTWTAKDANGNETTKIQKVTVTDHTGPELKIPADITVEASDVRTHVDIGEASAKDIFAVKVASDAPEDFPLGVTIVKWTATDANGNVTTANQKVTIIDTTKPLITAPVDVKTEANGVKSSISLGSPATQDIFAVTVSNDAPAQFPIGETIVTWTARDTSGNEATATQKVIIEDTTKPVLSVPADVSAEANAVNTVIDIGQAKATDIFNVEITSDAPSAFPLGTTVVTWTATDANGNVSTGKQNVTVTDTIQPSLEAPADVVAEANGVKSILNIGQATGKDIFDVTITNNAPAEFPLGTTTVIWTAVDPSGNKTTAEQKVTVADTTDPVLIIPAEVSAEATAVNSPVNIGTATATDIFPVSVSSDAPAAFPLGTTVVTWTATDANGNKTTGEQKVTVVDTTKPVLTVPADITAEASAERSEINIGSASATDIFPVTVASDSPVVFPLGTTIVTWTATDVNGNTTTAKQTVTVQDKTKPELTAPADITVEATGDRTEVSIGSAKASDIFGVTVSSDAPGDYPLGTTVVTWTAKDGNGNESTATQTITVVDTTKPVLTIPENIVTEATDKLTPVKIGEANATDLFKVEITNDAPAAFPVGTTDVHWTAKDANGNETTGVQEITVQDTTKPVLTLPADKKVEASDVESPVDIGTATAADIFDVTVTSDAPGKFPLGTTVVTWKAKDANGNETTGTQNITVVDTTKPVLHIPANIEQEATAIDSPVDIGTAKATDIFGATVTNNAPAAFSVGTTDVVWVAVDGNGNISEAVQKVTVKDTTKPELTVPADVSAEANAVESQVDIGTATTADIFPVTVTNNAPKAFKLGETIVTWTARDSNGNTTTAAQKVTVADTTKPVLTVPADITVEQAGVQMPVDIGNATATDIFDVQVTSDAPKLFKLGTTVITWTARDANKNVSTGTQKVTVVDTIAPVVKGAATTLPNSDGWYNSNVTVHFDATDSGSGVKTVTPDIIVATEGLGQSVVGVAVDMAGNAGNVIVSGLNIDKSAPVLAADLQSRCWDSKDIVVTPAYTDRISGIKSALYSWSKTKVQPTTWTAYTGNGITQSQNGVWYLYMKGVDKAGNSTIAVYGPYKLDKNIPLATQAVVDAENAAKELTSPSNVDATQKKVDDARVMVNKLLDEDLKAQLLARLDAIQVAINEAKTHAIKVQMYNANCADKINTLFPWFKITNTGKEAINLSDIKVRYYYTIDGEKDQKFFCDWSSIGASNVTGSFTKLTKPLKDQDYYFELGFKSTAGKLAPGASVEVQLRLAKSDWTDYMQPGDYSYRGGNQYAYADWDKVTGYIGTRWAWGKLSNSPPVNP